MTHSPCFTTKTVQKSFCTERKPKENFHRSLHEMGFLHSTKVQNKPHPLPHLSLLPSLFIWLLAATALNDLRKLLLQNGYPQGIINYHINDVVNKNRPQHSNPVSTVPKKHIFILLPYLGLQSNQVSKRLKSCVYKFYSCVNLKIVFQSTRCIKSFISYKDRINGSQQSRVIYRANCWYCNGFYIGKTKQRLHERKTEHFKALAKNDNTLVIIKLNKFNMFITAVCVLFFIKLRWPEDKSIYDMPDCDVTGNETNG